MTQLVWHSVGDHLFETGIDRGALYIDGDGYAWNGLVSVDVSPTGGEAKAHYLDGVKYLNLSGREEFGGTITAVYSPPEFDACDGLGTIRPGVLAGQQRRKSFGFSWRSGIGNDVNGVNHGYKIHIVYNALAAPAQRNYNTMGDEPEVQLLAWSLTAKPRPIPGMVNSSYLTIDTTQAAPFGVSELESILYGTDLSSPRLPDPDEIVSIFTDSSTFLVTDLGGEQFEISGSDLAVFEVSTGRFQITADTVVPVDEDRAEISSP